MMVQMLVKHIVPFAFGQGAKGIGFFAIKSVGTKFLRFFDVVDQARLFLFKISFIRDQKLRRRAAILRIRLFTNDNIFHEKLQQELLESACFRVFVVVGHFIRDAAMRKHLPNGHFSPLRLCFWPKLIDSCNNFCGDLRIKDIFHWGEKLIVGMILERRNSSDFVPEIRQKT